ncbi:SRPBCC family protein [Cellulomonas sp. URHE0023]|uniref:SRPBCC family protein n=1 Tax=Cellulomonas sp. URHE0023 TaxID=1380354 RepID=UPI000489B7E7|nr:SRPBCC family protein [Cellulomonas sp. URHE0023]
MATVAARMSCRPDAVLAVLADGWSYATWVVGTSRLRGVDVSFPAPGSTISHSFGVWPAVIDDKTVVLAWRPDRGIELQARGWPAGEAHVRIEVMPHGEGCSVRIVEDVVRGPGLLIPRLVRTALLIPRNRETLRRLAHLAEGRSAQSEST